MIKKTLGGTNTCQTGGKDEKVARHWAEETTSRHFERTGQREKAGTHGHYQTTRK